MASFLGNVKAKFFLGGTKVKGMHLGSTKVYSSGNIVTYMVDTSTKYTEEVEDGVSVLSPKTFTPTKSGWTFVGWRTDKTASATVATSLVMGDDPITLYAVFRLAVTCTFYSGSADKINTQTATGYRYYNNGNIANASIKVPNGAALSGWTWRGWSGNGVTTGNASVAWANGATITGLTTGTTHWGLYQRTLTAKFNGNNPTSGSTSDKTGTNYYNSNGNHVYPTITLPACGYTRTDYRWGAWALSSVSGTQYAKGASYQLTGNVTFYAYWVLITTNFAYTGKVQTYTVPVTGYYRMICKGGNGNCYNYGSAGKGGTGGTTTAFLKLTKGTVLYVVVGGGGTAAQSPDYSSATVTGGYNGGGGTTVNTTTGRIVFGAGGGATHIATRTGLLSALSSYGSAILAVAGGGAGCSNYFYGDDVSTTSGEGGNGSGGGSFGVAKSGTLGGGGYKGGVNYTGGTGHLSSTAAITIGSTTYTPSIVKGADGNVRGGNGSASISFLAVA